MLSIVSSNRTSQKGASRDIQIIFFPPDSQRDRPRPCFFAVLDDPAPFLFVGHYPVAELSPNPWLMCRNVMVSAVMMTIVTQPRAATSE